MAEQSKEELELQYAEEAYKRWTAELDKCERFHTWSWAGVQDVQNEEQAAVYNAWLAVGKYCFEIANNQQKA